MLATLTLFLGLPLALATEPQNCAPLVPVTFDNSTIPQVRPALIQTPILSFPVSIPALMDMGGGYGSSVFISLPAHACFPKRKSRLQHRSTGKG